MQPGHMRWSSVWVCGLIATWCTFERWSRAAPEAFAAVRRPRRQPLAARLAGVPLGGIEPRALILDCDGVIADSEYLHRDAYNQVFAEFGVDTYWSKEYYDELQNKIGGGKPKMRYHFGIQGWPASKLGPAPEDEAAQTHLIDALQDRKTEIYQSYVAEGRSSARPGIVELIDISLSRSDLKTAICSAGTREAAQQVLMAVLGEDRLSRFDLILLGDDVSRKKPDPLIYRLASERLGVSIENCAVVEDSKPLSCKMPTQSSCDIPQGTSDQTGLVCKLPWLRAQEL
ncbi:unnamed protein product [Durusdinium trenchii]|uniref:Uncharacterized protein n=1 Tax=Durusdinium trenchii TaxID=1381693 RepID=A0ABP0HF76_9DINO